MYLRFIAFALLVITWSSIARAGEGDDSAIEELTYLQHPGLPPASSKIFFSKRRWTISGFGEVSYTHYLGDKNRASGDIELYNTNLYRFVLYGAARPVDWLVLYAEGFIEVFHDAFDDAHYEALPEVFVDLLPTGTEGPLNVRAGFIQVPIGYINTNDEPIMFHSVNRPEVERVIVPSQWVELGAQAYGKIGRRMQWLLLGYQGVDTTKLNGATWLRGGRNPGYAFRSPAMAGQIIYSPIDHLELSVSGVFLDSTDVAARTSLFTGYARLELGSWTFMAMGAVGRMNDTKKVYELTHEVVGSRVYGAYGSVAYDVLPLFTQTTQKLPLFARYERLDTHASIDRDLEGLPVHRSELDVLTVGVNWLPKRNIALKLDYGFRHNRFAKEGDHLEIGAGFIF